jgi:hypothetical protein
MMNWKFNQADQWEGTDDSWHALVARFFGQGAWSAIVYLAMRPEHRYEQHGFVDADAARAWCETKIARLSASRLSG